MSSLAIGANPLRHFAAAPRCAQCQTVMALERVEPHPADCGKECHTYICPHCRLADRVDRIPGQAVEILAPR